MDRVIDTASTAAQMDKSPPSAAAVWTLASMAVESSASIILAPQQGV